mgnify:CR=1 FL=1
MLLVSLAAMPRAGACVSEMRTHAWHGPTTGHMATRSFCGFDNILFQEKGSRHQVNSVTFRALRTMRGREANLSIHLNNPSHTAPPSHCPTAGARTAPRPCPCSVVAGHVCPRGRARSVKAPRRWQSLSVLHFPSPARENFTPGPLCHRPSHTLYNPHTQPQARPLFESASLQPPTQNKPKLSPRLFAPLSPFEKTAPRAHYTRQTNKTTTPPPNHQQP